MKFKALLIGVMLFVVIAVFYSVNLFTETNLLCRLDASQHKITASQPRSTQDSTLSLTPLWGKEIELATPSEVSSSLLIVAHNVCNQVVAFNLHNGDILWTESLAGANHVELDLARNRVYVSGNSSKSAFAAFALSDGEKLWDNNSLNHQRFTLVPTLLNDDRLVVSSAEGILLANPETGVFSNAPDVDLSSPNTRSVFIQGNMVWLLWGGVLRSADVDTGAIDFEARISGTPACCIREIHALPSQIVLRTTQDDVLWGIDRQDHTLLWSVDEYQVVSNTYIDREKIYFLDQAFTLHILDVTSGEELENVIFEPSHPTEVSNRNHISVGGSFVAIYFQHTNTLSVYEIEK